MYSTIEDFISIAIPAWDVVYKWPEKYSFHRLDSRGASYICTVPGICGDNGCDPSNMEMEAGKFA